MNNDYIISILMGEKIISHVSEILRNPDSDPRNGIGIDEEELRDIVNEIVGKNPLIVSMSDKQKQIEGEMAEVKEKLINLENSDQELLNKINNVENKLEEAKSELSTKIENTAATNLAALTTLNDNINKKFDILIEMNRAKCTSESSKKDKKRV